MTHSPVGVGGAGLMSPDDSGANGCRGRASGPGAGGLMSLESVEMKSVEIKSVEVKNTACSLSGRAWKTVTGGNAMKRMTVVLLAGLSLLAFGGNAVATTSDGALITNIACATYMSSGGAGFAVSYCVTATVLVGNPGIALQKIATPTMQASGGIVRFMIWLINTSPLSSAFNITVTDRLPDNMEMLSSAYTSWNGGSGGTFTASNSSNNTTWTANLPGAGQDAPYYLRWVLDILGPNRSAFVTFDAVVL